MVRIKSFNGNKDKSYFIFSVILLIIFLIVLGLFLEIPNYYPGYKYVSNVYLKNLKSDVIPANTGINVINITINQYNNTLIAFVKNSSNMNITIVSSDGRIISNQEEYIGVKLNPGFYKVFLVNSNNMSQYTKFDYGIFNYNFISSFYSGINLLREVYEIIMAITLILAIYSAIKGFFRR
ncbi:hypothetical protein DJ530_08635 [Sulfolobus sp. E1]|uniref:hypothetical protein n=1 Tax=Saccharolobus sp. A20 TaxID=1891280 RepID=UPI00084615DC|nr:hypothetical protein [Sulfolobus sp. A20]TRM74178.1 hypothetical protein DJ523_05485 [Sulfolobus sp. E5]TRM74554.1 hypothetical protein DJ532_12550 [Sulfolobus sp. A20-N-F8]TRM79117.1 hypothetical protein DJ528_02815 [Sulfolobus sp. B5]TRM82547.1 hypothetical protein DJ524_00205 [Sulfolobus sp. D5]TRM86781.1 hypothetical protein DJ529_10360 [Sulfolobus sp. C3]TRM99610.1 hypothetical protein DJ530_08635 [Sulfolobus sp. E1]TRN01557.1 hypothetical protein DJ527_05130 [Sulfolobus sp. F1]